MKQKEIVHKHIKDHGSITSMEAFSNYGITRLAARVHELRGDGVEILSHSVTKGKTTFAIYTESGVTLAGLKMRIITEHLAQ